MGINHLSYFLLTRLCLIGLWLACQMVGVNVYASGPPTPAEVGKVYGVHDVNVAVSGATVATAYTGTTVTDSMTLDQWGEPLC